MSRERRCDSGDVFTGAMHGGPPSRRDRSYPRTLEDVRGALEKAGIEFIAENGGGPGVRLRKAKR